jgi:hypothetical protein
MSHDDCTKDNNTNTSLYEYDCFDDVLRDVLGSTIFRCVD